MNAAIEYDGKRAWLTNVMGEPVVLYELPAGVGMLAAGSMVSVCAWHGGQKELTKNLTSAGYQVSHGICETCAAQALAPETTQQPDPCSCDICKEVA